MKSSRLPLITTWLVLAFFYLPIGVLILNSFNGSRFGTTWQGFTFKWYERLLEREDLWAALVNSLQVAAIASIGASSTRMPTFSTGVTRKYRSPSRLRMPENSLTNPARPIGVPS